MTTSNLNDVQPGISGENEKSLPLPENPLGSNGGIKNSTTTWMNTPDAISARIALKEVLIEEEFPAEMVADLFDRYELHGL